MSVRNYQIIIGVLIGVSAASIFYACKSRMSSRPQSDVSMQTTAASSSSVLNGLGITQPAIGAPIVTDGIVFIKTTCVVPGRNEGWGSTLTSAVQGFLPGPIAFGKSEQGHNMACMHLYSMNGQNPNTQQAP